MKRLLLFVFVLAASTSFYSQKKLDKDISKRIDKYNNTITWSSPSFGKGFAALVLEPVKFIKAEDNGNTFYYLNLTTYGSTLNVGETGAILLFTDGTKWERPNAKIDADVTDYASWKYSIFETISEDELKLFQTKDVEGFKLYIYTREDITFKKREKIKGWAAAIERAN